MMDHIQQQKYVQKLRKQHQLPEEYDAGNFRRDCNLAKRWTVQRSTWHGSHKIDLYQLGNRHMRFCFSPDPEHDRLPGYIELYVEGHPLEIKRCIADGFTFEQALAILEDVTGQ